MTTTPNEAPYEPIACAVHDHYEAAAVRGTLVTVQWREADGTERRAESRIEDILVRDGAEYLVLAIGEEIRLDRIVSSSAVPGEVG